MDQRRTLSEKAAVQFMGVGRTRSHDRSSCAVDSDHSPGVALTTVLLALPLAIVATVVLVAVSMLAPSDAQAEARAYEMVTPEYTQGGNRTYGVYLSDDGDRIVYLSAGVFADSAGMNATGGAYQAVRTPTGWSNESLTPGGTELPTYLGGGQPMGPDMLSTIWTVYTAEDKGSKFQTLLTRRDDGSGNAEWIRMHPPFTQTSTVAVGARARDASSIVVGLVGDRSLVNDESTDTRQAGRASLYRIARLSDGGFQVDQLAKRGDGATIAPTCASRVGGGNAVTSSRGAASPDLSRVVIGIYGTGPCAAPADSRVWVWVRDQGVTDISSSVCSCGTPKLANFEGGSTDVRRVYFTTAEKLTAGNGSTGTDSQIMDLYEYDFDRPGQKLVSITPSSDTTGSGVSRVTRVSEDGSRAYFVSTGRLLTTEPNGRGVSPVVGGRNLYVYHRPSDAAEGTVKFVATLASNDSVLWGQDAARTAETPLPDGRYLYFVSRARLTADEAVGDITADIFRYDAQTEELRRVWRPEPEFNGAGRAPATFAVTSSVPDQASTHYDYTTGITEDGERLVFTTAQQLDPADVNDKVDVYLWDGRDGSIALVSGGRGPNDVVAGPVTPDGRTIMFTSSAQLVPQHTSAIPAVYVARVGGGFAPPPPSPTPCDGDGCQGRLGTPPALAQIGSINLTGTGNVPSSGARGSRRVTVSGARVVTGSAARLRVRVGAAGRISVSGESVRTTTKSASKAQTVTLKVILSAKAKRMLAERKRLSVKVRVAFKRKAGGSRSKTVTVTFKQRKPKSASSSIANSKGSR